MTQTAEAPSAGSARPRDRKPDRGRRPTVRRPVRRFLIVSHRWLSLILGLVLLVITMSGAVLLYRPELQRAMHRDAYAASGKPATISLAEARQIVLDAHPDFPADSVIADHGVYRVTDYDNSWTVDPATGVILGSIGESPGWLKFLDNVHECFLSCEGYPGTVPFLTKEIPQTGWLGHEGSAITGGSLVLGVFGLVLLYLSITGIWLWFPRPSRWKQSMSVRWQRGRFARDTDLHKVGGMIALAFLLLWAITGTGYEFEFVENGWYAVTPGGQHAEVEPASAASDAPDISLAAAVTAAQRLHPNATVVSADMPDADTPESAYTLYLSDGFDPWAHWEYPGDLGVFVDRHTGVAQDYYGLPEDSMAQQAWENFNFPLHTGSIVNGWWKLGWLIMGLSPLLLAITGVSTWLVRRRTRRTRTRSVKAGKGAPPLPSTLAEELAADPEMAPDLAEESAR